MTKEPSITELVLAAQSGDAKAFESLHRLFGRMVHGLLLSRMSRADAEDLVQDVFLQAWQKLPALREPKAFGSWLARLTRNCRSDFYRSKKSSSPLPESLESQVNPDIEAREILDIIRSLPETDCEILILRLVEGFSGPEIAEKTGRTPGSTRVQLHRSMTLLRSRLGMGVKQ